MDRLIATNSVASGSADTAPVSGTAQYATSGNPGLGVPATVFPAYAWNAIQEELMAILAAASITADRTNNAQVLAAIKALIAGNSPILTDTGAANAYVAAFSPAITSYADGLSARINIAHANTAGSTINLGGGVVSLLRSDGSALQAGDLNLAVGVYTVRYRSSLTAFVCSEPLPSQLAASAADIGIGASTSKFITPASLIGALGFSKGFVSSAQTITTAGSLTLAHGIARVPKIVIAWLECISAELNYSVGDLPPAHPMAFYHDNTVAGSAYGFSVVPDATNLNVRFGNISGLPMLMDKSTGQGEFGTASKWNLILLAWG